jgi:hypothetical protein
MQVTEHQRTFSLALWFEAGDLFVLTHVERLRSLEDAERILADKPSLVLRDGWLWLQASGDHAHKVCSSYECYCGKDCGGIDECGRWTKGMNRLSEDDYFAAQLGIVDFLKFCSADTAFRLSKAVLTEDKDLSGVEPLSEEN